LPAGGDEAGTPQRQAMAADVLERVDVDRVPAAELGEVLAQPRPLRLPAADADVDVVALREDPAVAAGDRAQLDVGEPAVLLAKGGVAFEGDTVRDRPAEPERLRGRPVRAVRADDELRVDLLRR